MIIISNFVAVCSLQPNLYTIVVLLKDSSGAVIDCEACRVGVRQISTRPKELLVNGEPVVIRGVNRHEHHPRLGKTNVEACMIKVSTNINLNDTFIYSLSDLVGF